MVILCNTKFNENADYQNHFDMFPTINLSDFQKWAFKSIVDNQHILVTAHTGSGKTLPAEFAIQYFVAQGKKVIYTAPIKALSNTKLSDLRAKYPHISFGIITGDITDNPEADVLIMTTEILPNTLVNRELQKKNNHLKVPLSFEMDIENELAAVVFDEVHYINDKERGGVWEQAIIMLPPQVQLIMLSATIDRPSHLAEWIEHEKQKQSLLFSQVPKTVYLAPTNHRVVPLTHYLWVTCHKSTIKQAKGTKYEFLLKEKSNKEITVKNEHGVFDDKVYHNIADITNYLKRPNSVRITRQHVLNGLIRHLKANNGLPAICFVFSKKHTEIAAKEINFTLFEDDSTIPNTIEDYCKKILISKLPNYKEYLLLPEYQELMTLLKKGIGIHHAGVLAVFREMIEMLFEKKMLRLLFATETLAVGINFSTTSVIYTGITKFDGSNMRMLQPHEYTQISGRAGRRGIDKVGKVWLCANLFDMDSLIDFKHMLTGPPQTLVSKFKFSFNLGLNMIASEDDPKSIQLFAQKSFMTTEIHKEIQECEKNIALLKQSITSDKEKCINLATEQNTLTNYNTKKIQIATSNNKQKKRLHREIQEIERNNQNIHNDLEAFDIMNSNIEKLSKLEQYKTNAENYISNNVERTVGVLQHYGFIDNKDGKRTVTNMGLIAGQFQELHPLVLSMLMVETNYFNDLNVYELVGLFACFANIVVSDDVKIHVPNTSSQLVNKITNRLTTLLDQVYDNELLYNVNSGSCYERCFDIQQSAMDWSMANDECECQNILCTLKNESNIFVGEFIKALLKINNVVTEVERAAELTQQVALLEKLSKIPSITLKYIATTQSLYV